MAGILSGLLSFAANFMCYTFSKQSYINVVHGLQGSVTEGTPIIINTLEQNQEVLITNFKVNLRTMGVQVPAIEVAQLNANYSQAGSSLPITGAQVQETLNIAAALNPSLALNTIYAWAILLVRKQSTTTPPNYVLADTQFKFVKEEQFALNMGSFVPLNSDLVDKADKILFADLSLTYGHQTWRDYLFGFKDSKFPGPCRLQPGDFLQFIWFGSNNVDFPLLGYAGVWARTAGYVSFELLPQDATTSLMIDTNSVTNPYKKFDKL